MIAPLRGLGTLTIGLSCTGAPLSVCLSASSVNAAAVAERPAVAAPVDTSKKPKELGFTMPGAALCHTVPALIMWSHLAD